MFTQPYFSPGGFSAQQRPVPYPLNLGFGASSPVTPWSSIAQGMSGAPTQGASPSLPGLALTQAVSQQQTALAQQRAAQAAQQAAQPGASPSGQGTQPALYTPGYDGSGAGYGGPNMGGPGGSGAAAAAQQAAQQSAAASSPATGMSYGVSGPNAMGTGFGIAGGLLGAAGLGLVGGLAGKYGGTSLGNLVGNQMGMGDTTTFGGMPEVATGPAGLASMGNFADPSFGGSISGPAGSDASGGAGGGADQESAGDAANADAGSNSADAEAEANGGNFARGGRVSGAPAPRAKPHRGGLLASATPGRADALPALLPRGGYVLPADVVSALGQGNTNAGARLLDTRLPGPVQSSPVAANSRGGFATGGVVPARVSGGEYLIPPQRLAALGNGDLKKGAGLLDGLVASTRSQNARTAGLLPGPK